MVSKPRSFWQKAKKLVIVGIIALLAVIVLIYAGYQFSWTGFPNKTLWDWLQLVGVLAIPVAVGFGTVWFTMQQGQLSAEANIKQHDTELQIASDNQREAALQGYIDSISELLLDRHLRELTPEHDEARKIARLRTLTVLQRLDRHRKRNVLEILYGSGLIDKDKKVVDLNGADLSAAFLSVIDLHGADLSGVHLFMADLSFANLHGANLCGATLSFANLHQADLGEADLQDAVLHKADVTDEQLKQAKSLKGTILRDGSKNA